MTSVHSPENPEKPEEPEKKSGKTYASQENPLKAWKSHSLLVKKKDFSAIFVNSPKTFIFRKYMKIVSPLRRSRVLKKSWNFTRNGHEKMSITPEKVRKFSYEKLVDTMN